MTLIVHIVGWLGIISSTVTIVLSIFLLCRTFGQSMTNPLPQGVAMTKERDE